MNQHDMQDVDTYRAAMGRLLMLYTQVDRLIMEACAERIAAAPDETAKLGLAKQVGDESKHVAIQRDWLKKFCSSREPVISTEQESQILEHFRRLDWTGFLADMYLCVEALGSEAVERIVPLTDPGTRESLRIPLEDELDHVAFGIARLKQELAALDPDDRTAFLARIPERIETLTTAFHGMGVDLRGLFEDVGADYDALGNALLQRRDELLQEVAEPLAA